MGLVGACKVRPVPAEEGMALLAHGETIARLKRGGVTSYQTFRLRRGGKAVVLGFLDESRRFAQYSYVEGTRQASGFFVSRLGSGTKYLVTTWESIGLWSLDDIW